MSSNFDFLEDKKLFNIISKAERLYLDEYFEQAVIQTGKFAELICKKTLGVKRTNEETFDEALSTLKDILNNTDTEKEFIDDLYFLKKQRNLAAHEDKEIFGGIETLECIKRAFELAINYAIISGVDNKKILNLHFDVNLLVTGKKETLKEKYQKVKEFENESISILPENSQSKKNENKTVKKSKNKKQTKKPNSKINISKNKNVSENSKDTSKKEQREYFLNSIIYLILVVLALSIFLFILPF